MGPVVLSVMVVGACIAMAVWLAVGRQTVEPATAARRTPRARPAAGAPWWVRTRSAVLLGCLSTVLGVLAAVAVGAVVLVLFSLLQSSVG